MLSHILLLPGCPYITVSLTKETFKKRRKKHQLFIPVKATAEKNLPKGVEPTTDSSPLPFVNAEGW